MTRSIGWRRKGRKGDGDGDDGGVGKEISFEM